MTEMLPILFIVSSLVLIITPGQDMMLVMSRSIAQGWKAGVSTAAGVSFGLLGHTVLAALGLGAVLKASAIFYLTIKLIGAGYLIYLGFKLLRNHRTGLDFKGLPDSSYRKLFFQGAFSNISNPKITIFYFAYLPQFVPTGYENPTLMLLFLGTVFSLLTFVVKGPVGYGAGILSNWMRSRRAVLSWINRVSGGILIALGLRLVLERRS